MGLAAQELCVTEVGTQAFLVTPGIRYYCSFCYADCWICCFRQSSATVLVFYCKFAEAEAKEMTFSELVMQIKVYTEKVQNQFLIPILSLAMSVKKHCVILN
jgi:hypothetical protein